MDTARGMAELAGVLAGKGRPSARVVATAGAKSGAMAFKSGAVLDFLPSFITVLDKLETAGIQYMIVGSLAVIVYGEPRLTRDMDLVADIPPNKVNDLAVIFPQPRYYLPPLEILAEEVTSHGYFNALDIPAGLKVDFVVRRNSAHALTEFQRRRRIEITPGLAPWFAAPEDVIIKKLDFYREGESEKHLIDIRGILAHTPVDTSYLNDWINRLGLAAEWALTGGSRL